MFGLEKLGQCRYRIAVHAKMQRAEEFSRRLVRVIDLASLADDHERLLYSAERRPQVVDVRDFLPSEVTVGGAAMLRPVEGDIRDPDLLADLIHAKWDLAACLLQQCLSHTVRVRKRDNLEQTLAHQLAGPEHHAVEKTVACLHDLPGVCVHDDAGFRFRPEDGMKESLRFAQQLLRCFDSLIDSEQQHRQGRQDERQDHLHQAERGNQREFVRRLKHHAWKQRQTRRCIRCGAGEPFWNGDLQSLEIPTQPR